MNWLQKKRLSRRTVLRGMIGGAALALPLPPLDVFFDDQGRAHASGGAFPGRFGLFFWGNGILPDRWIPETTGVDWELTDQLAPLAGVKESVSVITGMEVKTSNLRAHIAGPGGFLTGKELLMRPEDETFDGPSLDQIIAAELGSQTLYRSLEVAVEPGARGLSHNGPDSVNPPESDPVALFERLFGPAFRTPGDEPIIDPTLALRRSVLDSVLEDAAGLSDRLGIIDQVRLEQHMDAVRDLELRIARLEEEPPNLEACVRPPVPEVPPAIEGRHQLEERSRIMTDLVTMAFACDLTRSLSYWYSHPLTDLLFPDATAGHHQLTHDEPGDQPQVHSIVTSIVRDYAYLVDSLRSIPEGDGTLLDNSVILGTTDVSYGRTHQIDEYPILLAGSACGRLRTGLHYRSTTNENASKVPLSILRAMGIPAASFGEGAGFTDVSLSEIEA